MLAYLNIRASFFYADNNGSLTKLFLPGLKVTDSYNGIIIFGENYKIYVLRSRFRNLLKFTTKRAGYCFQCGSFFSSKKVHSNYCLVSGKKLRLAEKLYKPQCKQSIATVNKILEKLKIRENLNDGRSKEPDLVLIKSLVEESNSTISIMNEQDACKNIFFLYFYLSNLNKTKLNLKNVTSSSKAKDTLQTFLRQYDNNISLSNLENFFKIRLKFYIKSSISNKLSPCEDTWDKSHLKFKGYLCIIAGHNMVCPKSHTCKWCKWCLSFYSSLTKHLKTCNSCCKKCLKVECTAKGLSKDSDPNLSAVICENCQITFYNSDCFENHKSSTCMRLYECKYCKKYINRYLYSDRHECNKVKCATCGLKIDKLDIDHQCKIKKTPMRDKPFKNYLLLFYDFETFLTDRSEVSYFQPCLLNVQSSCARCTLDCPINNLQENASASSTMSTCTFCANINRSFIGTDCVKRFVDFVLQLELTYGKTVSTIFLIAHNAAKFDSQFLLGHVLSSLDLLKSPPIMKANKLLLLQISNKIKCIDSYLFTPISLKKFSSTFDLSEFKCVFPHDWFTSDIFFTNFVKFPSYDLFDSKEISEINYELLKAKYCDSNGMFYVRDMLAEYCSKDTSVLRLGFNRYIRTIVGRFKVHPLNGTLTYSSLAYKIYKKFYMPDDIYVFDRSTLFSHASKEQLEYLYYIRENIDANKFKLVTARDVSGEVNVYIKNKRFKVDGALVYKDSNEIHTLYEYFGCSTHFHITSNGNPCKLNNGDNKQLYFDTMERLNLLKRHYRVEVMWSCDWTRLKKQNREIREISRRFQQTIKLGSLCGREAMMGGRVETYCRFFKANPHERIRYVDIQSLYPYVQKKFPYGYGKMYKLYDQDVPQVPNFIRMMKENPYAGIAFVTLSAPRQLLYPVLGMKINGNLCFCLCPTCARKQMFPCEHNKEERMIYGSFTYVEILKALEVGYTLEGVYEIIFCKKTAPIFRDCVNHLLALKIENSGFPKHIKTQQQKEEYAQMLKEQGIEVNADQIQFDPSARYLSKLFVNGLWGRSAINTAKYKKIGLVKDDDELIALLEGKGKHTIEQTITDVDSKMIMYIYSDDENRKGPDCNLFIASFVTANARLVLYEALQKLGSSALYGDTDSVIFYESKSNPVSNLDIGWKVGQFKDEIEEGFEIGSEIEELVAPSPKCYSLKIKTPSDGYKYIIRTKGSTVDPRYNEMHHENIKKVVLEENCSIPYANRQFHIMKGGGSVTLRHTVKQLRDTSRKRYIYPDRIQTLPFGYME